MPKVGGRAVSCGATLDTIGSAPGKPEGAAKETGCEKLAQVKAMLWKY